MDSFEQLKVTLKEKWLDYYQVNAPWIKIFMLQSRGDNWIKVPGGNKRPHGDIILGVITALEPTLIQWMTPFCQLTSDPESLVDTLGLNFAPDRELKKRETEKLQIQETQTQIVSLLSEITTNPDTEYSNKIRQEKLV